MYGRIYEGRRFSSYYTVAGMPVLPVRGIGDSSMKKDTRDMRVLRERVTRIVDDIWEDASGWEEGALPHHDKNYYRSEFLRICRRSGLVFGDLIKHKGTKEIEV